jgi:hypothetical protein
MATSRHFPAAESGSAGFAENDVEMAVELRLRDVLDGTEFKNAGIVHKDARPAQGRPGLVKQALDIVLLRHVGPDRGCPATLCDDALTVRWAPSFVDPVIHGDCSACLLKALGDCRADALRCAGHNADFALQAVHLRLHLCVRPLSPSAVNSGRFAGLELLEDRKQQGKIRDASITCGSLVSGISRQFLILTPRGSQF